MLSDFIVLVMLFLLYIYENGNFDLKILILLKILGRVKI